MSLFLITYFFIIESLSSFPMYVRCIVLPRCKLFSAAQLHFDGIYCFYVLLDYMCNRSAGVGDGAILDLEISFGLEGIYGIF